MTDTGMKCLITIANYYGIGADEEHLRHVLSLGKEPVGNEEILRIAKRLKLKAKCIDAGELALCALPVPAMRIRLFITRGKLYGSYKNSRI